MWQGGHLANHDASLRLLPTTPTTFTFSPSTYRSHLHRGLPLYLWRHWVLYQLVVFAMGTVQAGVSWLFSSLNIPSPRWFLHLPLLLDSLSPELSSSSSPSSQIHIQQSCPQPQLSCPANLPEPLDTCCMNHPSGHFLLAQFWDTSPPTGPNNSWSLHGLWPDYCTGGFPQFCDDTRHLEAVEIVSIVDEASKTTHPGLRAYMDEYWKGLHGDESLWSHEWNKHGTCVSTLEPKCYSDDDNYPASGASHQDLLDYFAAATTLHSTLQTHDILASHGVVPSVEQTYSLSQIQSALSSVHDGYISTVKCNYRGELNEIWMHYTVLGPLRSFASTPDATKIFNPVAPDGLISTCPEEGIKYLPKMAGQNPNLPPIPNPGQHPFSGRGYLKVHVLDEEDDVDASEYGEDEGCLIRTGAWYQSGTCATYSAKPYKSRSHRHPFSQPDSIAEHSFTLASTAGSCGILEYDTYYGTKGEFMCTDDFSQKSTFEAGNDSKSDVLSWKGNTVFYADRRPGRFQKVRVFADNEDGEKTVKVQIRWESR